MSSFSSGPTLQRIIVIVERLLLPARHCFAQPLAGGRSSNRLTFNVIRNQPAISLAGQQRKRKTLDETNIASPQAMHHYFPPISCVCPSRAGTGRGGTASLGEKVVGVGLRF